MSEHVTIDRYWCLTAAGDRVVPEGDPEARRLHWVPGQQVLRSEAKRFGAVDAAPEAESGDAETAESKGGEAKRRTPHRNKARAAGEDK